jgi:hypothetical protein
VFIEIVLLHTLVLNPFYENHKNVIRRLHAKTFCGFFTRITPTLSRVPFDVVFAD